MGLNLATCQGVPNCPNPVDSVYYEDGIGTAPRYLCELCERSMRVFGQGSIDRPLSNDPAINYTGWLSLYTCDLLRATWRDFDALAMGIDPETPAHRVLMDMDEKELRSLVFSLMGTVHAWFESEAGGGDEDYARSFLLNLDLHSERQLMEEFIELGGLDAFKGKKGI